MTSKQEWYRGDTEAETALLFGEVSKGRSPPYIRAHFGQDAYELYQIGAYLKELIRVRATDYLDWAPGFRLFGDVAADLIGKHGRIGVEDYGSTLFSTIDKLDKLLGSAAASIDYFGVEVSQTFCEMAEHLHPNRSVRHVSAWRDLPAVADRPLLSRAYQATSYGIDTTEELAEWMSRAALSLQGLWISDGSPEKTVEILGKRVHLFDYDSLRSSLERRGRKIAALSSQRYSSRGSTFLSVWAIAFDPSSIDVQILAPGFLRETRRDLFAPAAGELPESGPTLPHAGGLADEAGIKPQDDVTFNFGSERVFAAYAQFKSGV